MSNQPMNKDKQPQTVYIVNGGEKLEENFATVCPVSELECVIDVFVFTPSELSSLIAEKQREAAENAFDAGVRYADDDETDMETYLDTNYPINK